MAPLVFKTSGTGTPRPVGSIPAASARTRRRRGASLRPAPSNPFRLRHRRHTGPRFIRQRADGCGQRSVDAVDRFLVGVHARATGGVQTVGRRHDRVEGQRTLDVAQLRARTTDVRPRQAPNRDPPSRDRRLPSPVPRLATHIVMDAPNRRGRVRECRQPAAGRGKTGVRMPGSIGRTRCRRPSAPTT